MHGSPHILLIDPHPVVRRGLSAVIAESFAHPRTTGAENFTDALQHLRHHPADLVISEFHCAGETLPALIRKTHAAGIATRFLACSALDESHAGVLSIRAGASGFIAKTASIDSLTNAIRSLLAGHTYIPDTLARTMAGAIPPATADPALLLSARELEIFTLLGRSLRCSQIAATLKLSVKTVEAHREHIKNKLSLQNAAQVTAAAIRWTDSTTTSI